MPQLENQRLKCIQTILGGTYVTTFLPTKSIFQQKLCIFKIFNHTKFQWHKCCFHLIYVELIPRDLKKFEGVVDSNLIMSIPSLIKIYQMVYHIIIGIRDNIKTHIHLDMISPFTLKGRL